MKSQSVKSILKREPRKEIVCVQGWIRSVRKSKTFSFLMLNDGSCQNSLQIIADQTLSNYGDIASMPIGTSCRITGLSAPSGGRQQAVEVQAESLEILGTSQEDYPIQKKALSLEFLRTQAHLRMRTNLFGAVFRLRHHMSMATHNFFHERGHYYLHSPIITAVDAEGAGEQFTVTALDLKNPKIDFERDYFSRQVSLCVTGQLEAECMALGLGNVYTFGPTFRAENSNTPRHLAEFWMVEPETAFCDLEGNRALAVDYLKYLVGHCLEHCSEELEFLTARKDAPVDHLNELQKIGESKFQKITYTEAVTILENAKESFEYKPQWGSDLQTEHERYLTEKYFQEPIVVVDYPKDIKAFYMRANDDGKTVAAMDVLVPGVGEIIGGSQREERFDKLLSRMREFNMDEDALWWYLDLRRYGSVIHSGFGLGFERAVMYVSGMKNIRDVIAFPRTPRNCDF